MITIVLVWSLSDCLLPEALPTGKTLELGYSRLILGDFVQQEPTVGQLLHAIGAGCGIRPKTVNFTKFENTNALQGRTLA